MTADARLWLLCALWVPLMVRAVLTSVLVTAGMIVWGMAVRRPLEPIEGRWEMGDLGNNAGALVGGRLYGCVWVPGLRCGRAPVVPLRMPRQRMVEVRRLTEPRQPRITKWTKQPHKKAASYVRQLLRNPHRLRDDRDSRELAAAQRQPIAESLVRIGLPTGPGWAPVPGVGCTPTRQHQSA